jgi:MFS family permease
LNIFLETCSTSFTLLIFSSYPAINDLSRDLGVSYSLINLTITVYLIFMGLAPTIVGSISDVAGRRPAYLICFIVYIAANIGLSLQDNYAALMVLRCLQSSGSSGTVALGNAMVADIATSSERGSYIGYASVGALVGPAGKSICPSLGKADFDIVDMQLDPSLVASSINF